MCSMDHTRDAAPELLIQDVSYITMVMLKPSADRVRSTVPELHP